MESSQLKKLVANAVLEYIPDDIILGVGTGSTVDCLIDELKRIKGRLEGAVPSSKHTEEKLKAAGIPVIDFNVAPEIPLYIDGADEFVKQRYLLKGRGGALVREKIMATAAKKFIALVDDTKRVDVLGTEAPIPVELVSFARSHIARAISKMGGTPIYREGFISDNGNQIIDIFNFLVMEPRKIEEELNRIPGVIDNGLFVNRPADIILIGTAKGVELIRDY